jgi:hypothetical protein
VRVNGTLVEDKMLRFKAECAHFSFNRCQMSWLKKLIIYSSILPDPSNHFLPFSFRNLLRMLIALKLLIVIEIKMLPNGIFVLYFKFFSRRFLNRRVIKCLLDLAKFTFADFEAKRAEASLRPSPDLLVSIRFFCFS